MQTLLEQLDPYWNQVGGVTRLAELLGVPITTVHSWKRRRTLPAWRIMQVEEALRTLGQFNDLNDGRQVG